MYALLALGTLSFVLCLILTPLCRNAAVKFGFVDIPDDHRKRHAKPVPRIGGVAIMLSYGGALALMLTLAPLKARIFIQHKDLIILLLPAVIMVFLTGLVDDLITLKPLHKLSGQAVAAVLAVSAGARITWLDGHPYSALASIPLSIFWLLLCTNAFNLIDGMDGLAAGVGLFATCTTLLAALLQGNWGLAMATIPLAGCLLAFLRYNFNPASVFLGDCGSLTIGFVLGCFGIIWSQKSATFLGMLAPAMALALPLFDVALSVGRRFLRNEPIFKADAGHIHHKLLGLGFHPRTAAFILYAACGIAAILSLLQSSFGFHVGGIVVVLFCLLAFLGIKSLGYVEFSTVKRLLTGSLLGMVRHEIYLAHLRERLLSTETSAEFWAQLRAACHAMEFSAVHLHLDGESFEESFENTLGPNWQLSMSFGKRGSILLKQPLQHSSQRLMTSVFRTVHECVQSKTYAAELVAPASPAHAAA